MILQSHLESSWNASECTHFQLPIIWVRVERTFKDGSALRILHLITQDICVSRSPVNDIASTQQVVFVLVFWNPGPGEHNRNNNNLLNWWFEYCLRPVWQSQLIEWDYGRIGREQLDDKMVDVNIQKNKHP